MVANNITQDRLRKAVSAACTAVGLKGTEVIVSGRSVTVVSHGIEIFPTISSGDRVWRCTRTFSISSLVGETEKEVSTVVFEEPFDRIWAVAKSAALHIAETRIDAAIDQAAD